MKKTLSLLTLIITLMMALSITAMAANNYDYSIDSADELLFFAIDVTDNGVNTKDQTWTLTIDISLCDLTETNAYWPGIGSEYHPFEGTFIGGNHLITLLTDDNHSDTESVGYALFNYIGSSATIQNVTVAGSVSSDTTVGGLVTYSNGGTITDCTNSATVTTTGNATDTYTGGIVACATNSSNISDCTNEGTISGSGSVGGVAGFSQTGYTGCTDTGTINGTTTITRTMFSGVDSSYTYTGSAIEPTVSSETLTSSDYSVSYGTNTTVATGGTITITGEGAYSGTITINFAIATKDLSDTDFSISPTSYTYTGSAIEPTVTSALTLTTDYTVVYGTNTEIADGGSITITAQGSNCTGSVTINFDIDTKDLSDTDFSISATPYTYTGSAIEPTVSSETLTSSDYSVSYSNNTEVGQATITITGAGNYGSSVTLYFEIAADSSTEPVAPTITFTEDTATVEVSGTYTLTDSSIDGETVTGWTVESGGSSTGIVYSPNITFYVPESTTLTITAITGGDL